MAIRGMDQLEGRVFLSTTRFAVIGDFGTGDANEGAVASLVKSWQPDFVTTVGDNNYDSGLASDIDSHIGQFYHDFIYPYNGSYGAGATENRFFPSLGNHDWGNTYPDGDASAYLNYFTLPGNERYYDFARGAVHFFMLDSDPNEPDGTTPDSVQGQWLKNALANATEPHKLVFFHHAAYSSSDSHGSTIGMRWPFAKWGATGVFAGHDHTYERLMEEGIPYFVDGIGGNARYGFSEPIAGSQFRYNDDFGAMLVDATGTVISYRLFNTSNQLIDSFTQDLSLTPKLIGAGSTWKYLDNGSEQGANWRETSFDDSTWAQGDAQLGYGDGDEATVIGYGGQSNNKYITTYFRKTFLAQPGNLSGLELSMLRDDGAIVYLNGHEVFRTNMPAGTVTSSTPASSDVNGSDEGDYYSTPVDLQWLQSGANVVAVELHQSSPSSDDASFDLSLTGIVREPPPTVTTWDFQYDNRPMKLQIGFSRDVSASLDAQDIRLRNATTGLIVDPSQMNVSYDHATDVATVTFPGFIGGWLYDGAYRALIFGGNVTDAAGHTLADVNLSYWFYTLAGDANRDGVVNVTDLAAIATNWQASGRTFSQGDFNYDGRVDVTDLGFLATNWQKSVVTPQAMSAAVNSTQAVVAPMPHYGSERRRVRSLVKVVEI